MKSAAAALIDETETSCYNLHVLSLLLRVRSLFLLPRPVASCTSIVQYLSDWPLCRRLAHGITANLLAYEYESYDLLQPAGCVIYTATVFETKNVRGSLLQRAYKYLLTVSATSVEAERAFSTEGSFVQCCSRVWATNHWMCCVL